MTDADIIERLKGELGEKALEITNPSVRRIFIKIPSSQLIPAVTALRDRFGFKYLATISGLDKGETFELIYHFGGEGINLNLRTEIPRNDPHIESVTPVIPGAILYERELQDMFGIVVDHIPDHRPLLMPDDWPAGNYPLRKDWKFERPEEIIPGGKK
ncbi:MAG TPA: NADH-quinone oxidoreductase subunit C [Candidatus Aminicenantes bacterium]|nr:NADH-quinone oxidoreductase subunit C [Candidatus Aminicenantes bacterium]